MKNYSTPSSMHWISTLCAHVLRREEGKRKDRRGREKGRVKEGGGEGMEEGEGEKGRWKRGGARGGR